MLFFNGNDGSKIENIISNNLIQTNDILELKRKVKLAKGQEKVDLVVKNANILNVFSGDIHETVLLLLMESLWDLERGMWPKILIILHGTSAVICDPHEIANVLGLRGIDYFLQTSHGLPVKIYLMMPPCVPATSIYSWVNVR